MPMPVRTTTLLLNRDGSHAAPIRGAKPHWRPVSVVLLTPAVPFLLLPAMMKPLWSGPRVPAVSPAWQRAGGRDVGVKGGIEVEDVSVLLGQSAVPVVADTAGKREVRLDLELVLQEEPKLIGPEVAVGVALQEGGDVIVVVGVTNP
jgi:hypothetical protein